MTIHLLYTGHACAHRIAGSCRIIKMQNLTAKQLQAKTTRSAAPVMCYLCLGFFSPLFCSRTGSRDWSLTNQEENVGVCVIVYNEEGGLLLDIKYHIFTVLCRHRYKLFVTFNF